MGNPTKLGLLALCLSACTVVETPEGLLCEPDDVCPTGQSCIEGVCTSGEPALGDEVPPTVVSLTPTSAGDVAIDTPVVIRFSEPMQPAVTAASVTIEPETPLVDMQWNDGNTELTLRFALERGEAEYPAIPSPKRYTVTVSAAEDVSGSPLADDVHASFTTTRAQTHVLRTIDGLSGHVTNPYSTGYAWVGSGDYGGARWHGHMTFDTLGFPSEDVGPIMSATIEGHIYKLQGEAFQNFGDLHIEHGSFGSRTEAATAPVDMSLGVLLAADEAHKVGDPLVKDVTEAVIDDLNDREARGDRSQFLLKFYDMPAEPIAGTHTVFIAKSSYDLPTTLVIRTALPGPLTQ